MGVKVITGLVRFSYANVWEPKKDKNDNLKYSVALLFPKKNKNALNKIIQAIDEAVAEGKENGDFGKKNPGTFKKKSAKVEGFKWCLRDGETKEENEEYQGMMFLNASSKEAPLIGDADKQEIVDEDEFYSGCWGRASIVLFPYNSDGNIGIGCYLHSVQKLKDGERLSGRDSLENDFDEEIEEDEFDVIEEYGGSEATESEDPSEEEDDAESIF